MSGSKLKKRTISLILKAIPIERIFNKLARTKPHYLHMNTKSFFSIIRRPKKSSEYFGFPYIITNNPKTAVIVQGPLNLDADFTLETINLYTKRFHSPVILSTWQDENIQTIELCKKAGAKVLLNPKPHAAGFINLNYQICSTLSGIRLAKELGAEYVLKSRTDCRIYAENSIDYLLSLLSVFKLPPSATGQKERIVAIDTYTHKLRPYSISDICQFGTVFDMECFWNNNITDQPRTERFFSVENTTLRDDIKRNLAEPYLAMDYLKRLGVVPEVSIKAYYKVLRDRFIIIDKEDINLYWYKYGNSEYKWPMLSKSENDWHGQHLTFKDWLLIYNNLENIKIDEQILDLPRRI